MKYAVSDDTGEYVFFTDDYKEAKDTINDMDGNAAIMIRVDSDKYELCY